MGVPLQTPEEWQSHISEIISSPGITVVVGDLDTGKTSFCALLANAAFLAGVSTAVVDGDIGQSEIGPPTTIGLGLMESEIRSLSDLSPRRLHFVGSTSLSGHLLATVTGVKKMVDDPIARENQLIIVDTAGMVRGPIGRKFITHQVEVLSPRHIVALQRSGESEHFLKFLDTWEDCSIHRLSCAPERRTTSSILRSQRRAVRFREYFLHGSQYEMPLESLATTGTWLHTGDILEPKYLKFSEQALGATVFYGERISGGIYLIAKAGYNRRGVAELQEQFKTKAVTIVPADTYMNLVIGLLGKHLELLALGIIKGVDFRSQTISVYTPLRSVAPVRSIRFGVLKLRPDGTEIGHLQQPDGIISGSRLSF